MYFRTISEVYLENLVLQMGRRNRLLWKLVALQGVLLLVTIGFFCYWYL